MANDNVKVFSWDDMITNDGNENVESVVLPDGTYPFEVIKVEKEFFDGSANLPACNMAKLFMRVDGGALGKSLVVENIHLCEKTEWKAAAFLRSVGMKKHNEPIQWKKLTQCDGETGRMQIRVDEYTGRDGSPKKNNKLVKWFDKEEIATKKVFKAGEF